MVTDENNYWWGDANLERPEKTSPNAQPASVKPVYTGWGGYTDGANTWGNPVTTNTTSSNTGPIFVIFDIVSWDEAPKHTQTVTNPYYVPPAYKKPKKAKIFNPWGVTSRAIERDGRFYRRPRFEGWDNEPKQSIRACSCQGRSQRNYRPRA